MFTVTVATKSFWLLDFMYLSPPTMINTDSKVELINETTKDTHIGDRWKSVEFNEGRLLPMSQNPVSKEAVSGEIFRVYSSKWDYHYISGPVVYTHICCGGRRCPKSYRKFNDLDQNSGKFTLQRARQLTL
ncbi:16875_t:CDS:2, partial [Racocetra persica]